MCTSLLSAWDGEALDVEQNIALAIVARSPIERLVAFKQKSVAGTTSSCFRMSTVITPAAM